MKREIEINGATYIVTIAPEGLKITMKRGRTPLVDKPWPEVIGIPPR